MNGIYDRPQDIPKVGCPHCGGQHRPEAVPVNFSEPYDRYIAGTVTCPAWVEREA